MAVAGSAAPKRELNIRPEYLALIADGVKTVEVRVGYPRLRTIRPGQELTFVSGTQRVSTLVKRVSEYPSFEAMLDREDAGSIGGELGESRAELLAAIRDIYPPDKERLGGARDRDRTRRPGRTAVRRLRPAGADGP
jgi:ASC-1-like (ASCH) protein